MSRFNTIKKLLDIKQDILNDNLTDPWTENDTLELISDTIELLHNYEKDSDVSYQDGRDEGFSEGYREGYYDRKCEEEERD